MPLVRAVIARPPIKVARVELHVTNNLVPSVSSAANVIWLLAVTAVVLTVTVVPAAAMTTLPAAAEPHTAGAALLLQLVAVPNVLEVRPALLKLLTEPVTVMPVLNDKPDTCAVKQVAPLLPQMVVVCPAVTVIPSPLALVSCTVPAPPLPICRPSNPVFRKLMTVALMLLLPGNVMVPVNVGDATGAIRAVLSTRTPEPLLPSTVAVAGTAVPLMRLALIVPVPVGARLAPVPTNMAAVTLVPLERVEKLVLPAIIKTGEVTKPSASTHTHDRVFCVLPLYVGDNRSDAPAAHGSSEGICAWHKTGDTKPSIDHRTNTNVFLFTMLFVPIVPALQLHFFFRVFFL